METMWKQENVNQDNILRLNGCPDVLQFEEQGLVMEQGKKRETGWRVF
jgi:hypothetical protein